ncbi:hypothetical protein BJX68DRAFT_265910 [Aspergillus pseudodeflectus]|uniref:Rhodopsin domain-containing protein n=1 Tax=Aspergillus pseudodeflectus TaxID=176178 RepID=A0ABR4KHG2_9EURO
MLGGRSESLVIVIAVMLAVSLATVCLRCFVRVRITRKFACDDGLMVLAMVFNLAFAICGIVGATFGIGRRRAYFANRADDYQRALLCWWLGQIFYILTTTTMRQSIVILLFRFTLQRIHKIVLWIVSILSLAVGIIFLFFTIFQCSPVDYYWKRLTARGNCIDIDVLIDIVYFYSAVAAACDLTIGLLPAFLIRRLRASLGTKAAIAVILGIGCVASAAVIVRIPFLESLKSEEILHATSQVAIWSNIEASLGITAGSLAPLRPLCRNLSTSCSVLKPKLALARIKSFQLPRKRRKVEVQSVPATNGAVSHVSDVERGLDVNGGQP